MVRPPEDVDAAPVGKEDSSASGTAAGPRESLLTAVVPVFARRGYRGTTVDDLLAAAKVGFGNFYSLFGGKEECFLAAFDLVVGRARERIGGAAAAGGSWAEQTYLGLRSLIGAVLEDPLEGRLILLEAQSAGHASVCRFDALMDEAVAWLVLGRELRQADLPASYEQAAISGLVFYLQQCVLHPSTHDAQSLLEEVSTLVLEPMIGGDQVASLSRLPATEAG
jgi:AcrR family transcriptional regulator